MELINTRNNQNLTRALGAIVLLLIFLLNSFFYMENMSSSGKINLTGNHSKYGDFFYELRKWKVTSYRYSQNKLENLAFDMVIHIEKNQLEIESDEQLFVSVSGVREIESVKYAAKAIVKIDQDVWPAEFKFKTKNIAKDSIQGILSFKNNPRIFSKIERPIFDIKAKIEP